MLTAAGPNGAAAATESCPMRPRRLGLVLAAATTALGAGAASANDLACDSARAGLIACVAGKLCACRHDRAVAGGLPAGFRWDCGVLRPACGGPGGDGSGVTLDRYAHPLPPGLSLGSQTNVTTVTGDRNRVQNAR